MEIKRIISVFASCALVFSATVTTSAAKGIEEFAMLNMNMPEITAELRGTDHNINGAEDVSATYGDDNLTVNSVHAYTPSEDSAKTYLVVDASVENDRYVPLVRDCMKNFVAAMGENDAVEIVKFGSSVDFLLDGDESLEEINEVIDSIEGERSGTALYTALDKIYKDSAEEIGSYTRQYAIVFSDCKNAINAGVTEDEVNDEFSSHLLPLYACAPPNAEPDSLDTLGKIARASGGDIAVIQSEEDFGAVLSDIDDVTIISMSAPTNNTSADKKTLSVKINDSTTYNAEVAALYSITDSVAPEVTKAEYDEQNKRFVIEFSEQVLGADERGAYSVESADGKKWTVSNVEALAKATAAQLEMEQSLSGGEYTISFNGITDASKEKNPVASPAKVQVTAQAPAPESSAAQVQNGGETQQNEDFPWWIFIAAGAGLLVLIGAGVAVLIILLKKRKNRQNESFELPDDYTPRHNESEQPHRYAQPQEPAQPVRETVEEHVAQAPAVVKHHVKTEDSVRVSLKIKTGSSSEQTVETTIVSSVIVGRSSACDIFIDDTKLSRQHFAIENVNHELFISDMESKNGTFLNGTKIATRRKIMNGDKILAGLSEISVKYME